MINKLSTHKSRIKFFQSTIVASPSILIFRLMDLWEPKPGDEYISKSKICWDVSRFCNKTVPSRKEQQDLH